MNAAARSGGVIGDRPQHFITAPLHAGRPVLHINMRLVCQGRGDLIYQRQLLSHRWKWFQPRVSCQLRDLRGQPVEQFVMVAVNQRIAITQGYGKADGDADICCSAGNLTCLLGQRPLPHRAG